MTRAARKKIRHKLRRVLRGLERMYGPAPQPPLRRGAGLDTLVEAMLAQNTNMINAERGYRMLRRRFPSWTRVMDATVGDVQREIAVCGLARMRARRLQNLLRIIKARHRKLSLDFLGERPVNEAFDYLMGFYGIGPKTAAFTLLFGFGQPVLPVDNAVLRVVRRLRLVRPTARDLEAEQRLSPLIAEGAHYSTHVLLFRHGKERCRPKNPKCEKCTLLPLCPFGQRVIRHRPPARDEIPVRRRRPPPLVRFVSDGIIKHSERDE